MSHGPPSQVCPLCADDDQLSALPGEPGTWMFTCTGTRGHETPYSWPVKVESTVEGREGITEELGVYDDLLLCVHSDEPWVEHGVVEHRYKLLKPAVYFKELLPTYGHVAQGPKQYTLSAFLARALGQLRDEGALAWQYATATGFWAYNGSISYWAIPPAPPADERATWEQFALDAGLDPKSWNLDPP